MMDTENTSERIHRERETYNEGLERDGYHDFFSHTCYFYLQRRDRIVRETLQNANGKKVLELGSISWLSWVESNGIRPAEQVCINISERELQTGIQQSRNTTVKPRFLLMDANNLAFEDQSFDVVFGCAILHHLDFVRALDEVRRVLKPGGCMLFVEPLAMNPVGKLVRIMTPEARTVDEQPLRVHEIQEIKKRFDVQLYCEELLSVPLGVLSKLVFRDPDNWLTRSAFQLDLTLERLFPPLKNLYRHTLIAGTRK